MAKLTNPLMSQDARGSVAGVQYSRNRSGNFGSRKSTTTHVQSDAVLQHRARIKEAHTAWLALTPERVAQWEAKAPPTQTGRNAFVGAALRNLMHGEIPPLDNPLAPPRSLPIHNLHFSPNPVFPFWSNIHWDWTLDIWCNIMLYIRVPRGFAVPHVRQFYYKYAQPVTAAQLNFQLPMATPRLGLRVLQWDHANGTLIREWRANASTTGHYYFEPP